MMVNKLSTNDFQNYTIIVPPKHVGRMEILPDVYYGVARKPKWFHRLMMRLLLGWKWEETKEQDDE